MTNTPMKDFFELALPLCDTTLDDEELQQAVEATFTRRQTAMPGILPSGLSDACANDTTQQTQWRGLLNKNGMEPMDLRDVIGAIRARRRRSRRVKSPGDPATCLTGKNRP